MEHGYTLNSMQCTHIFSISATTSGWAMQWLALHALQTITTIVNNTYLEIKTFSFGIFFFFFFLNTQFKANIHTHTHTYTLSNAFKVNS